MVFQALIIHVFALTLLARAAVSKLKSVASALPLRTDGRWIVGSDGQRVKLACINWSGAEEKDGVIGGLQRRHVQDIVATFRSMRFNCVRLPWSVWMVLTEPVVPFDRQEMLLEANPEMEGKHTLDIFDAVIDACANASIMVVLDNHMSDGDWCCRDLDENGLWYNSRWSELQWLEAHIKLAGRYATQPWVVGTELRNEVRNSQFNGVWHAANWGGGGPNDWHAAATRAGNAVLGVNPNLLIVVGGTNYGKDLTGVYKLPIQLSISQRLVYAAHCYGWSYPAMPNKYEDLKSRLGRDWGYIIQTEQSFTAPVWVSEFGTFSDCKLHSCAYWWPDFLRYLLEGDFDWAAWHADGTNSRASFRTFDAPTDYGVLSPDWHTPANGGELLDALQTIQHPTMGPGVDSPACNERCADTFKPNWQNGRTGAAACSACLRNRHCRGNISVHDWCQEGWAKQDCGWTCCRANLLSADSCSAGHCQAWYIDAWNPQWPDQKANSAACLRCLRDGACRKDRSETAWCATAWAQDHCSLTCCIEGFHPPPNRQRTPSIQI